jgi:hypothetical protein
MASFFSDSELIEEGLVVSGGGFVEVSWQLRLPIRT